MINSYEIVSKEIRRKHYKFMLWAHRIMRRRGFRIYLNACNTGQVMKVGKVLPLGQGCVFQPNPCYGCYLSQFSNQQLCWLQDAWIPCPIKVETGETIFIPSLTQTLEGLPILKLDKNKVFHSSLYL